MFEAPGIDALVSAAELRGFDLGCTELLRILSAVCEEHRKCATLEVEAVLNTLENEMRAAKPDFPYFGNRPVLSSSPEDIL
jgi:hypothetical protein